MVSLSERRSCQSGRLPPRCHCVYHVCMHACMRVCIHACMSKIVSSYVCPIYTDCLNASSMKVFKNKVDTYLRRAGYAEIVGLAVSQWLPNFLVLLSSECFALDSNLVKSGKSLSGGRVPI